MELLDLYDDDGKKLNETIVRGEKPAPGKNIMLSVVFIKNWEGKYLIQKSSLEKGGEYTTTGGHVTQGEDGLTTIIREMSEEIGIDAEKSDLTHIRTIKYPGRYCLFDIYLYEVIRLDISRLILQESEVSEILWLTEAEILDLIDKKLFLESHGYIFKNYICKAH